MRPRPIKHAVPSGCHGVARTWMPRVGLQRTLRRNILFATWHLGNTQFYIPVHAYRDRFLVEYFGCIRVSHGLGHLKPNPLVVNREKLLISAKYFCSRQVRRFIMNPLKSRGLYNHFTVLRCHIRDDER